MSSIFALPFSQLLQRTSKALRIVQIAIFSQRCALRDSPDNPFLTTPEKHAEDTPSPHGPPKERPTIAYVYRGVECKNPLYSYVQGRPFSPPPESKLPIDHPDYSPAIHRTAK
ncbi:hypothetical protein BYT27DRAFT_6821446 [Phlegmacium glaucopus]|nr:hypothetical protein BYT27DRAFT_6821446 [Phlegmacium glaucopus]